ncbi:Zn-dependent hydrolase [Paenibacillus piri]|uniref:Zn-dependent hydrolase n=2 Tax=Paenibacillus piri TaxID=2547395 RepID=A0A4R5L0E9_9BACL|nr:Zn-dependent hydrolase [Paenibacillus piri]
MPLSTAATDASSPADASGEQLIRRFAWQAVDMLDWLAQFGGETDGGVTRLLYSPEWQQAQTALSRRMLQLGFEPYYDEAGNLFGRLAGKQPDSRAVLTGSHIDTVLHGGRYDGAYGIIAGLIAAAYLRERYGQPLRSIEIVAFAEEEGSRFPLTFWGSGNATRIYSADNPPPVRDADGVTLADAMHAAGFGLNRFEPAGRNDWEAFVELHIEQGSVLERERCAVGIVQGIVGQQRFTFEVTGVSNHAGTTPMGDRQDALCGASEMILAVREEAVKFGDPMVATVGQLTVVSGASNVVPGHVHFTMDARHPDPTELDLFCRTIEKRLERLAGRSGLSLTSRRWMTAAPIPMNAELAAAGESSCRARGLSFRSMYSGAGHDAQLFAAVCPTAMIFVPSRAGISHSPDEHTEPEQLGAGIAVLADLLHSLAYR